ncbi:MAG: hypothetical protein LQ346_005746 [Caloplaca aetnensis]|nr:MAG: hypothetical protein LQ346_005746 [Caloplaca aetnensis]
MATRAITYVWKIQRPPDDLRARVLMAAAYQTAKRVDPNVTTVLVRSPIHSSSRINGQWVKDDPHVTICAKNSTQEEMKTHEAAHGYTVSLDDPTLVRHKPSYFEKPDDTRDYRGNEIWPTGLPTEVVMHSDP